MIKLILILSTAFLFSGCVVGKVVAAPFKVTGAIVNTVTPDIVGDSISGTGEVLDTVIPF